MPFTLAHPAAVLPLRKLWPSAFLPLVLGSIGPDLPFFLPSRIKHALGDTHSLQGTLTLAPLLAFTLLAVVVLLEPALLHPLWGKHRALLRQGLSPWRRCSVQSWARALPALCLGSFSHYLCDAATHENGRIVSLLPILTKPFPLIPGHTTTAFQLLQYGTSLAGIAILVWWYSRQLHTMAPPEEARRTPEQPLWLAFIVLAAMVLAARAVLRTLPYHPGPGGLLYASLTHFVSDFSALYVLWGLMCCVVYNRRIQAVAPGHDKFVI